ncbi:MAG: CotH kinase family protein, partial [Clostridia bacterium]|nr:CotH kinase family protein [Clostridia bacterium]
NNSMRKTKLFVSVFIVLLFALVLVACGDPSHTTTKGTDTTTEAPVGTTALNGTTVKPGVSEKPGTTTKPGTTVKPGTTTKTEEGGTVPVPPPTQGGTYGLPDEMPVFYIDTYGKHITSKEEYIPGLVSIDNVHEAYAMEEAEIEIRGRGNYSWSSTEKKSYRIKFAEKTNLLGQGNGPARSWKLLAVHCDQSMLRTAAAFYFGRNLSGLDFISSASFAKVYLNGEFLGVYQVSEQMQANQYRVNVDDSPTDEYEIDFLVELNRSAAEMPVSDGRNTYEVKSDIHSDIQLVYIEEVLTYAYAAVLGGDKEEIEELIDLDSVVDSYIVEELMKNLDVGWGSFYMWQKVGGKLHFGPVWDFDLSSGNADPNDGDPAIAAPQYLYAGSSKYNYSQTHRWFVTLMKYDWFRELVKERWNEIIDIANELPKYVRAVAELYSEEFDENFVRWPIFGQQINREPAAIRKLKNHDEHAEYLAKWLETRITWLTKCFNGEVPDDPVEGVVDFECSGGNGTKASPYLIANADDFASFTNALISGAEFRGMYFLQTANINMVSYPGYNGVGKEGTFAGVYDGNGYIIKVNIEGRDEAVFPYVTGVVMNVVTQGRAYNTEQAAGISRSVRQGGLILNCLSTMDLVSLTQNAGGIVASNQSNGGTVSGCVFMGKVDGAEVVGPINAYMEGREGVFTYNYYIKNAGGNSFGNDTEFTAVSGMDGVLNGNLSKLASGNYASSLCTWKVSNDTLIMEHK